MINKEFSSLQKKLKSLNTKKYSLTKMVRKYKILTKNKSRNKIWKFSNNLRETEMNQIKTLVVNALYFDHEIN